eukprot:NODE_24268_length_631_cov_17.085317.p1 GENE.NODE_24268_length_631_cov_17.085317~~NODE_24268_length_631_cov_17.085317.p1  ORF type:complete len:180 (-),score=7.01 NODE_24268_length_631_cov_17.085317:45-584(-)
MEGGQNMHRHTLWGKWEKIGDGSSSSASQQRPRGQAVIPTGMDVLSSDSERNSNSIANIANDRVSSSATAMKSHEEGTCAPCRFHTRVGGCCHGANCRYCHEPHDTAQAEGRGRRPRPNKTVRARCKAIVDAIESTGMTLHDGEFAPTNPSVCTSYLTRLMKVQQKTNGDQHDEDAQSA